jgi:hypothetical protein
MSERHLQEMLEQLHAELQNSRDVDEKSRALLRAVMDDIRAIETGEGAPRPEPLGQRLREAVDAFEESHPALTEAVGRVVDALAKMGI